MTFGVVIALIGAAMAVFVSGIGSSIGVSKAGRAAAGVLQEKPDLFGKVFLLQALPATQGIYGFLITILIISKMGVLSGDIVQLTTYEGWSYFAACMPVAFAGLFSGVYQGKLASSTILMVGKDPSLSARGMTMTALVETYAILGLLISVLMYIGL